jgi:hydrogenase maturation protease
MAALLGGLRECLQGRTLVLGLGSEVYGDDGVGVRVAERLRDSGTPGVEVAGASPERYLSGGERWDNVVFVDAVDAGLRPGSVVLMDSASISARYPQVSTHRLSLGTLARYVHSEVGARAWLLGIQPASLAPGSGLSPAVAETMDAVVAAVGAAARAALRAERPNADGPHDRGVIRRDA